MSDTDATLRCTGIAAGWCPRCGDCTGPDDPDRGAPRDDPGCPLHAPDSRHGEDADEDEERDPRDLRIAALERQLGRLLALSLARSRRPLDPQAQADAFNALAPVGTLVRFWTGPRVGRGRVARVHFAAAVQSGHASCWVDGRGASVALTHVEVLGPGCGR